VFLDAAAIAAKLEPNIDNDFFVFAVVDDDSKKCVRTFCKRPNLTLKKEDFELELGRRSVSNTSSPK
jgi:hypothetical protein